MTYQPGRTPAGQLPVQYMSLPKRDRPAGLPGVAASSCRTVGGEGMRRFLDGKSHKQIVASHPVIVDGLKRGLVPEWATNLINDSHRITPVHSPLHQLRSFPVGGQFAVALCGVIQPHKAPNLIRFML